jgi:hypothetical protein
MLTVKLVNGKTGVIALALACETMIEPCPALRRAIVKSPLLLCTKECLARIPKTKDTAILNAAQLTVHFHLGPPGRVALLHAVVESNAVRDALLLSQDVEAKHASMFPTMKIVTVTWAAAKPNASTTHSALGPLVLIT